MYACNGTLFNHESPRRGENFVTQKIVHGAAAIFKGKSDCLELGNLDIERDWGYAPEYVEGMWKMLQQKVPEDFVLATNETHTIKEFVNEACKIAGISSNKVISSKENFRPYDVTYLRGSYDKAEKKLKWKPKTNIHLLIDEMITEEMNILSNDQ